MEAATATGAGPAGLTAAGTPGREGAAAEAGEEPGGTPGPFLSLPEPFEEEDENDRHKCGRCQAEFTSLEEFLQHKLRKLCQRQQNTAVTAAATPTSTPAVASVEEPITVAHIVVEASPRTEEISSTSAPVDSGDIKEVIVAGNHVFETPNGHLEGDVGEEQDSPGAQKKGRRWSSSKLSCGLTRKAATCANCATRHSKRPAS
ncbi:hypothetical protein JRQ81_010440 [Phrynocephalus forsythii]|uniref:Uncharacterized protein n=1 Tax=Phrynocephalus forsythii TaxID=171643 RepID=A0A9Q1ARC1_9SAUR|nr:hypothetical protein JRQ81_010440 [Phrynocephalus forsythii]